MKIRVLPVACTLLTTSLVGVGISAAPAEALAPSNDLLANATLITGDSGSVTGTTAEATRSAGEPDGFDPAMTDPDFTNSVWYRVTVPDDVGLTFSIPFGRSGISIGTYVSYDGGAIVQQSDDYNAGGWAREVEPGVYQSVAAIASTFITDTSQDDPPYPVIYYVRVMTTAAAAGPFRLDWSEGGLTTTTTATATADDAAGTFRIDPSTTCTRSFYDGPPPTPTDPADSGYYIVRDELGEVVGSRPRWDFYNPDGTSPAEITDLPLLPGSHTYTVSFYYGSRYVYCARSQVQVTVVGVQPTTTGLQAVVSRQKVTFTGTVTPAPPPGSSIQVLEGGRPVAGLLVTNGSATSAITGVRPGKHTYVGRFSSAFPAFADSSAVPITVSVPKYTTTTRLRAPRTAVVGARPRVRASVKVGNALAKGRVVFRVNGTKIMTRELVNGVSSVRLPKLARGKTTVTVLYLATTLNAASKASRVITVTGG